MGIRSTLCSCLLPDCIKQNSDIHYCNVCNKNVGGGLKHFETHKAAPEETCEISIVKSQKGLVTWYCAWSLDWAECVGIFDPIASASHNDYITLSYGIPAYYSVNHS